MVPETVSPAFAMDSDIPILTQLKISLCIVASLWNKLEFYNKINIYVNGSQCVDNGITLDKKHHKCESSLS